MLLSSSLTTDLGSLMPRILRQLGESNLDALKRQVMEKMSKEGGAEAAASASGIPQVESFDD